MKNFNEYLFEMEEIQNEMTGQEAILYGMVSAAGIAGTAGWAWYVVKDILSNKKNMKLSNDELKKEIANKVKEIEKNPELQEKIKTKIEKNPQLKKEIEKISSEE